MEPWVHNIIGLTLAFDMFAAVFIIGGCAWAAWRYDYIPSDTVYTYKNYNYEIKGDLKDATLEGVTAKPTDTANSA